MLSRSVTEKGEVVQSRNGTTSELLDFKTTLLNPYKRCIGVASRDINIFFLLAEAIWIILGKRDVAFLDIFNKNLKSYSDDGRFFYAPYGWRLRKYGLNSMIVPDDSNKHHFNDYLDQIIIGLSMLQNDPYDRRVVFSIWNPELDLGMKSKDLPCNDMIMLKIRGNKLYTTIQNRSNDLHWGLTTNIFQFSFLTECLSLCLDVKLGTQTHNSQSLHVYHTSEHYSIYDREPKDNLYDFCSEKHIDFNFDANDVLKRFDEIIEVLNHIYHSILSNRYDHLTDSAIRPKSKYLYFVFRLLYIYKYYQADTDKEKARIISFNAILTLAVELDMVDCDLTLLALNFFYKRIKNEEKESIISEWLESAGMQKRLLNCLGKF